MDTTWTSVLINQWKSENIELNKGASRESIAELETQLDFKFLDDFRELYIRVNGFAEYDWTRNMFSIWSLERIEKEYQKNGNPDFIGFCDYLINSHNLGFSRSRTGIFISYALADPVEAQKLIAPTFQEALHLINTDSEKIY